MMAQTVTSKNITDGVKAAMALRTMIAKRQSTAMPSMRMDQLRNANKSVDAAYEHLQKADYHYEHLYAEYKQAITALKYAKKNIQGALTK